jgi:hypothetical protein
MHKWEYKVFSLGYGMAEIKLNELGVQGWELFLIHPIGDAGTFVFVLKRLKP